MLARKNINWFIFIQLPHHEASIIVLSVPVGCLISAVLMEWLGRLNTVKLAAIPCVIGWVLIACAKNFTVLLIGRILTGWAQWNWWKIFFWARINFEQATKNTLHLLLFAHLIFCTVSVMWFNLWQFFKFFNKILFLLALDQQWVRAQPLYTLLKLHDLIYGDHWFL